MGGIDLRTPEGQKAYLQFKNTWEPYLQKLTLKELKRGIHKTVIRQKWAPSLTEFLKISLKIRKPADAYWDWRVYQEENRKNIEDLRYNNQNKCKVIDILQKETQRAQKPIKIAPLKIQNENISHVLNKRSETYYQQRLEEYENYLANKEKYDKYRDKLSKQIGDYEQLHTFYRNKGTELWKKYLDPFVISMKNIMNTEELNNEYKFKQAYENQIRHFMEDKFGVINEEKPKDDKIYVFNNL